MRRPRPRASVLPRFLPRYREETEYAGCAAWEYLGRYRVKSITDGGPEVTERRKITGRPIRYVIRLEEAR